MLYSRACVIILLSFVAVNCLHTHFYGNNFHQASPAALKSSAKGNDDSRAGYEHEKGYRSRQNKKEDGSKINERHLNEGNESEQGDKNYKHVDKDAHYNKYKENESGHKSNKFNEKKGHKRGHKSRGYHNKFIRDEIVREHKFYDNAYKSGNYEKRGNHNLNYESKSGWRKKGKNDKQ